ncbi:hypothetical protein AYR62_05350 [Secundilactobacillus paracollinoides]|uniref:EAL domain-containing protein n=1 Tax=Secundilactobacillus paracollinoides TaxID=240427 RepID=UPI0006D01F7C|nr:EAL domain-containing protein [Secundilactobacillus paracollinoides]ANZ63573.1 hypothetical protein AYR62_05350 [Secundilactobacillus paracollinoides]KRL75657.1 C-di-GMP-specific phosphodiesterase [Secundilactobacillus paracollinoides DSM 15502 = JCM 11969]
MYRYFVQPQVDRYQNSVVGYETLIREQCEDGHWQLPADFEAIPFETQLLSLRDVVATLGKKVHFISVNLNRAQFTDSAVINALISFQQQVHPVRIVAELTEEVLITPQSSQEILASAELLSLSGVQLSLDDVGTGENQLSRIQPLLPYTTEIKFAIQNFRHDGNDALIPSKLYEWNAIAKSYGLRLIVEGIETPQDEEILDRLNIVLRQGYFYGKPHLLACQKPFSQTLKPRKSLE